MEKIYRCGDCPICSFLGDLILLEALGSGGLFVFCPNCGAAFEAPSETVDEIHRPVDYAPKGFVPPKREQIRVAIDRGWRPRFLVVLNPLWGEWLGPGLETEQPAR